jgi:hypothetical protein
MPMKRITLRAGDVYRHVMAGGGGFGDPLEREPENVRTDVLDDKVTTQHAREAYGVVLGDDPLRRVNVKATEALRAARRVGGAVRDDGAPGAPAAAAAGGPVGAAVTTVAGGAAALADVAPGTRAARDR